MQTQSTENKPFIRDSQSAIVDFARPVAGVQVEDSHYSVRKVGYRFGAVEVVTQVQLVRDGQIVAFQPAKIERCEGAIGVALSMYSVPGDDAEYLLRAVDSVKINSSAEVL
jgi:hypothetical protein